MFLYEMGSRQKDAHQSNCKCEENFAKKEWKYDSNMLKKISCFLHKIVKIILKSEILFRFKPTWLMSKYVIFGEELAIEKKTSNSNLNNLFWF